MDISGVSFPTSPEVQQEPPRNAETTTAVRESSEGQAQNDESRTRDEGTRDTDSSLGRLVDERA